MSKLKLQATDGSAGTVSLKAPASTTGNAEFELTLPGSAGSNGQLLSTNGSGVLTWSDDNSGVSLSGSTNNTIATVTGANSLTGEANLTFDGSVLDCTGKLRVDIATTGTVGSGSAEGIFLRNTNETDNNAVAIFGGADDYSAAASAINFVNVDHSANVGAISFDTRDAGNAYVERVRINQDGNVGIGTDSPNQGSHNKALTISNTASGARTALEVIGNTANCHAAIDFKSNTTLVSAINSRGTDRLQFCTGSSGNVKAEVTGDNFKIEDGNLIIGTDGHGIDFSASADGPTMSSELFDDYEEGTFTPVVRAYFSGAWNNSGFNQSPNEASGWYTKVGNLVNIFGRIRNFQVDNNSQGSYAGMGGLPFTAKTGTGLYPVINTFYNSAMADGHAGFYIGASSTIAYTARSDSAQGHTTWGSGTNEFWYFGFYYV